MSDNLLICFPLFCFLLAVGIKVASWGAYLLRRDILAMSFAPRDTHEAQVQFALERGVPAMIGIMSSQRLPYPARAFDMAHCSRCLIPWEKYGKNLPFFVHSQLRPSVNRIKILSLMPTNYKLQNWTSYILIHECSLKNICSADYF